MLTRLLEHLLIRTFNRFADRRQGARGGDRKQRRNRDGVTSSPPSGHIPLGYEIPFLGSSIPPPEPVVLSPDDRRRHLYVLGATGTGKTTLLLRLIESDLAQNRSLCVVDLRGDLIDRILLRLAALPHAPSELARRLVMLDLRSESWSLPFNPLAAEDGNHAKDFHARAFHVLSVLKHQSDSWGIQLDETLRNALVALAATGGTLFDIELLLSRASFRASVVARTPDPLVRSFFERFDALSDDKQAAWRLPVLNKVTPLLAMPPLRRMFSQKEALPFRRLFDTGPGTILLVSLAADRLHGAAHLAGGLFLSSLENAVMSRADLPESKRVPLSLYVDEFETMASERFESLIAEGRRFGLSLCLSHQNLSQVDLSLRSVIRNNVHTQFLFQTGALDAGDLAGEIAGGTQSDSPNQQEARPSWQQGDTIRREAVKSLLMSQKTGETFLVRRGQRALRLRVQASPEPRGLEDNVRALKAASFALHARSIRRDTENPGALSQTTSQPPKTTALPSGVSQSTRTSVNAVKEAKASEEVAGDAMPEAKADAIAPDGVAPEGPNSPIYHIRHRKTPGRFKATDSESEKEDQNESSPPEDPPNDKKPRFKPKDKGG